jgi:TPR repeat protein
MNLTLAAELGSDVGAHSLGDAFLKGQWGLPKDPARARYWLNRAEDCRAARRAARRAAESLRELDGAPAEAARLDEHIDMYELLGDLLAD